MRPKKEKKVKLVVPKYQQEQEFGVAHAERLLDMGPALNGGWELPADSNYEYDEHGLRPKADKTGSTEAE